MFKIIGGKGFSVQFANSVRVSVQFGAGNYCDNYDEDISAEGGIKSGKQGSKTAETAILDDVGFVSWKDDDVQGRQTPEEVLETLIHASKLVARKKTEAA